MEACLNHKDILKNAHEQAYADIKKDLSEIEVMQIINTVIQLYKNDITPTEAAKEYAEKYKKPLKNYVEVFSAFVIKEEINRIDIEELKNLNKDELADNLVEAGKKIGLALNKYVNHDMTDEELFKALGESGMKEIGMDILSAYGIDLNGLNGMSPDDIYKVALPVMSCLALTEAFKILQQALKDEAISYERRIAIEKECQESILMIRQYRMEMDQRVSEYLSERLETFEQGFKKMDQAILENDVDGYLSGNQQIQEILGYQAQFSTMDEFDDLMLSDISFKL